MKKWIIGMLAVISILTVSGIHVFADYEEKAFLESISISVPEPEGEYVTRAEFIKSVLDMVDIPAAGDYEAVFRDVPEDRSDALEIIAAYHAGLINGEPGGEFRPDDAATTLEAVKILMNILGYQTYAEEKGGYPLGYLTAASEIDLIEKSVDVNSLLTKERFYFLLAEALEKPMLVPVTYSGDGVTVRLDENETLLKVYHNIRVYEGVLSANADTALTAPDGVGAGKVKIGDRVFRNGDVETEDYLGVRVKAYYTGLDTDPYLCTLRTCSDDMTVYTFMADEIENYQDGRLEYAYDDDKKVRSIVIPNSVDVIYNGRCDTFYDKNRITSADRVKLIDHDGDQRIDVLIVTEYEGIYVVDAVNENRILDRFGRTYLLQSDGYSYERFYENGERAAKNAITKGKVISVAVSADGEMITYYISGKTVFGTLEKISDDGHYVVGGREYRAVPELQSLLERDDLLKLGKSTAFYMDYDGRIAYADASESGIRVGYIMNGAEERNAFDVKYRLKLMDQTGEIKIFELQDKIKISVAGAEAVSYKPGEIKNVLGAGTTVQRQLIRYSLKSDGGISLIETAMEDNGTDMQKFRKQSMNQPYHTESLAFDGGVGVSSGVIVFNVPKNGDLEDDDNYSVANRDSLSSGTVIACDAYDISSVNVANYLVVPSDAGTMKEKEGKPYLITEIAQGITEEGEMKTFVTAYRNHNAVEIICEQSLLDNAEFAEHAGEPGYKKGLEVGDVAGFQLNYKGEAVVACKYLDISEATQQELGGAIGPLNNPYSSASGLHALAMRIWGRPGGSESGFIRVQGLSGDGYTYQANNASVIKYNVERGTVEKTSYSVLEDYKQDSHFAVYVHFRYSRIEDIFLYELP